MFTKDQIDLHKVHAEIRQVLDRQKELRAKGFKKLWPVPTAGHKGWFDLYMDTARKSGRDEKALANIELDYLSRRMTILCSILAHVKGKVRNPKFHKRWSGYYIDYHQAVPGPITMELQEKIIGDEWKQFLKPEEEQKLKLAEIEEKARKDVKKVLVGARKEMTKTLVPEASFEQKPSLISRIAKKLGF